MDTPPIKLQPIRMGSLVSSSSPLAPGQKYIPPKMRKDDLPQVVDLGVKHFPTLGSCVKKINTWGKHVIQTVEEVKIHPISDETFVSTASDILTMKDKIKEQIRQAQLQEEERQKPRVEDPEKMTREELLACGWAVLSLKPESVREAAWRLNTPFRASPTSEDYYE